MGPGTGVEWDVAPERALFGRKDYIVLALFALATVGFATAAVIQHARAQETLRLAALGRYNATPEEVIGRNPHRRGPQQAPFTLVEFGDYQCGPCRATEPAVKSVLKQHAKDLRYVFRDLPLTSIHPLAMQAAVLANRAGADQDFWALHDLLYSTALNASSLRRAEDSLKRAGRQSVAEGMAKDRVNESVREADALGIGGTPMFVLICPGGIVRRVEGIDLVEELIKPKASNPTTDRRQSHKP